MPLRGRGRVWARSSSAALRDASPRMRGCAENLDHDPNFAAQLSLNPTPSSPSHYELLHYLKHHRMNMGKGGKKILVIDNFDSFTFNLVDYFLQLDCEVVVYRNTVNVGIVDEVNPDLIVFSPGPSVPKNAGNMLEMIKRYHKDYPMFGVCLGLEAFIEGFGGSLKFVEPVHGRASAMEHDGKTILEGLEQEFLAGRYHSLVADEVPECFEVSATCDDLVMAIRHKELPIEGVQFHPESVLSMKGGSGMKMIENVIKYLI